MPTPSDETPSTGADTEDERKVEVNIEESTEKESKAKQIAKRSKSLGTLSDSKSFFPPRQRLSRRKTEGGGGIRVVWRTSPTAELEILSRVLGIQARNRSVSPMKRPEPVDNNFSEYYDPLAFHARLSSNSQGTATTHLGIPTAKRRNTLKRDTITMPSVKKLLSIFERSATTHNDPRTPNSDSKVLPTKEHQIKFPKADKNERLNQSMSGIVYDVYGQYRSKDSSEIYEDNAAIAPKPKIALTKTNSLPNNESEPRSQNENNNSNNLFNLNHEGGIININEVPSRKVCGQMYSEANKVAKPTTSVSFLKQKWESFVKERMKSKKVSKPADTNANDGQIVQPTKQLQSKINESFDKEFHRYHTDTLRRSAPFERNTTSRRSVKNMAKKYESMREGSTHSKDATEGKNKMAAVDVMKKIPLTPSKSLDNIKLLEKNGDPWTVDIKIQDNESLEVKKVININKIDAKEFIGLERKPSVRDLKKKFEVNQNNEPKIINLSALKKVEPATDLSPTKLQETELHGINSSLEGLKIPHEKDTLQINGDTTAKHTTNQVSTVIEQVLTDISIQSFDGDTKSEENIKPKVYNIPLYQDNLIFDDRIKKNESLGSKTVTKKSSIKIELSLSPPNPQKKTKLSIMPASALIDDTKLSFPIEKNNYSLDKVDADPKLKEETIENQLSKQEILVQSKQTNIQALRKSVDNDVNEETDSTLKPDTKSSHSEKIENVDANCVNKLSSTATLTSNSDSKSATAKTVLITKLRSPALKNSYTENSAEVQTVKIARLAQNKSENLILNVDHPNFDEKTSRALWKKQPTDTKYLYKSEVKKNEDWNDSQLSKQSEVKDKISESEEKDTRLNTETVIDKKYRKKNMNVGLLSEQPPPKLRSSKIASKTTDYSTDKLPGTDEKTNNKVNKTDSEKRHKGQTLLSPSRNQAPVPSERTKYLVTPTNVPESSFYIAYNSSSDLKSRLTSDVNNEQAVNSEKDLKVDSENHEKDNVKSDIFSHTYELNGTNLEESLTKDLNCTNSEESLKKDHSKGGSKFRNRKAARRAYTDSLLKHLVNSDTSPSRPVVPKDPEISHPIELNKLLYCKSLQDSAREVQSEDASVNKSIPPFLVRKTRSKSATSITLFNKVRELKPDELKFFKDLNPLSVHHNTSSVVSKDRASSVATSSPTSEAQSSLARTSSFERSPMRESQKYRKLHSDEMKFFGLNYTHS